MVIYTHVQKRPLFEGRLYSFANASNADSIRVIGLKHSVLKGFPRNELFEFVDKVKHVPFDCDPSDSLIMWINNYSCAYVDSVVYENREILNILDNIKRLKINKKLPYSTSQCPLDARYSSVADLLYWVPESYAMYYLVMIVFSNNSNEFIWVGAEFIERGKKQYKLSSEYKRILSKYSEVYKESTE